jgi:hypothetical protein
VSEEERRIREKKCTREKKRTQEAPKECLYNHKKEEPHGLP